MEIIVTTIVFTLSPIASLSSDRSISDRHGNNSNLALAWLESKRHLVPVWG